MCVPEVLVVEVVPVVVAVVIMVTKVVVIIQGLDNCLFGTYSLSAASYTSATITITRPSLICMRRMLAVGQQLDLQGG